MRRRDFCAGLGVLSSLLAVAAVPDGGLWRFTGATGGSIADALSYMAPFIAEKSRWPRPPDVEAWEGWPLRQQLPAAPTAAVAGSVVKRVIWPFTENMFFVCVFIPS